MVSPSLLVVQRSDSDKIFDLPYQMSYRLIYALGAAALMRIIWSGVLNWRKLCGHSKYLTCSLKFCLSARPIQMLTCCCTTICSSSHCTLGLVSFQSSHSCYLVVHFSSAFLENFSHTLTIAVCNCLLHSGRFEMAICLPWHDCQIQLEFSKLVATYVMHLVLCLCCTTLKHSPMLEGTAFISSLIARVRNCHISVYFRLIFVDFLQMNAVAQFLYDWLYTEFWFQSLTEAIKMRTAE